MLENFKIPAKYVSAYLKSQVEYKASFFMDMFVQVVTNLVNILAIGIVLNKFNNVMGWSFYEILFLYNVNLISFGLSGMFFYAPMVRLQGMVQQGTFDSILIRPINPLLHLIFTNFRHVFFGHLTVGCIMLGIAIKNLHISWTAASIIWLVFDIIGATLIQASMLIIVGTLSFWFVKTNSAMDTLVWGVRKFLEYPITIYNKAIEIILIFILPYAFVNFFPVQMFLGKNEYIFFNSGVQYATPFVGGGLFILAYIFWSIGINHYNSTGS